MYTNFVGGFDCPLGLSPWFRHGVIVIISRNRLQSITVFWVIVIVIDWIDQKWNVIVIVFDYIANLIVIDDYFRNESWKSSPCIIVQRTAVLLAGFLPLSPFVMVMFQGRPFARLCALIPNSLAASTAFVANSCFVPAIHPSCWPPELQ